MTENYDAVVVGGGVAGLTAAAYLARENFKVILLEKNEKCGGLVNSFSRDGFLFDGGVRALLSAGIIFPMLRDLEIDLEVLPNPVSIGIEDRIIHVASKESLKDYASLLKSIYPDSGEEIEDVIKIIAKIMKEMEVLYGVDNPLFSNFLINTSSFIKSYMPWFFKFIFTLREMNKMKMPVEAFLEKRITNRSLLDIIDQHFFENTPAFFALSYFYLYLDYFYPKGGVGKLAEVLQNKILECGGTIKTNVRVSEVLAGKNMVKDGGGNFYKYGSLIWAADLKTLYRMTSTEGLPKDNLHNIEVRKEQLQSKHGTDSVFILYLAVDERPEFFKAISHGHFFYTPSKQGLGETHRGELKDLVKNWPDVPKEELYNWLDRFLRLNTYEISIPVLKEPRAAPEGKTGLIISLLFDYNLVKKYANPAGMRNLRRRLKGV